MAISRLSLSISLSVSLVVAASMTDDLGVVSNDSGAVMHLLVCLLAVLGHDVLALLDVGRVHDDIVLGVALLPLVLDWLLVALLVRLAEALEVVVGLTVVTTRVGQTNGGHGEDEGESEHLLVDERRISSLLLWRTEAEAICSSVPRPSFYTRAKVTFAAITRHLPAADPSRSRKMSDTKCSTHPGAAGPDQENLMSLIKLTLFMVT